MILFFDTETTGFFREHEPVDDPMQPHIVQLAAQLCAENGDIIASFNTIVDPGVEIPKQASDVHKITNERAAQYGVTPSAAVMWFQHLYKRAELIVAHNIKFDRGVMEAAIFRHYTKVHPFTKPLFCTMETASPIINLPPTERMLASGFNKPKPPKLEECVKPFFNEDLSGAHDAMIDVDACRRVYFHLKHQVEP
jgi:DNA polymerase-3 subunit epsilon